MVGWSSLLDYLFMPMINILLAKIYFEALVPSIPSVSYTHLDVYKRQPLEDLNVFQHTSPERLVRMMVMMMVFKLNAVHKILFE